VAAAEYTVSGKRLAHGFEHIAQENGLEIRTGLFQLLVLTFVRRDWICRLFWAERWYRHNLQVSFTDKFLNFMIAAVWLLVAGISLLDNGFR
jgi:hypothetical protein